MSKDISQIKCSVCGRILRDIDVNKVLPDRWRFVYFEVLCPYCKYEDWVELVTHKKIENK